MRYIDEFRDTAAAAGLLHELERVELTEPVTFMEVCGSHTMAVSRFGIRSLLPPTIRLVSGPGCPVCVTPVQSIDHAIALARLPGVTLATFGDLMRVPGSTGSLERERAAGGDIRVVYSTLDALEIARAHPERSVVFVGIGFETTAPTVAGALIEAQAGGLANFFVLSDHKVMPPPMRALVESPDLRIRGFLCPGHVSAVIGSDSYRFLSDEYGVSCAVAGFEPLDILQALVMLTRQAADGVARVENGYGRAVTPLGNRTAQAVMREVFEPCDSSWRGFGTIPESGLRIRPHLAAHDAARAFSVHLEAAPDDPACRCPQVLRGVITPPDCPLFARTCTPTDPRGTCMVSSEGTCAAYYRYERHRRVPAERAEVETTTEVGP